MEFSHTDEQAAFREEVTAFVENEVRPIAATLDREEAYPATLLASMAERGWTGLTIPESHGGLGRSVVDLTILIEELSKALMPLASTVALHLGVAAEIETLGGANLRKEYLASLASFDTVAALGLTEAQAGTDTMNMQTTAERDGSDWILSGEKQWVTNYLDADLLLLYAKTGPEAISAFLVPAEEVTRETIWDTIGAKSVKSVSISFDQLRVPDSHQLGPVGRAYERRGEAGIGINLPARAVGIAQAALDETIDALLANNRLDKELSSTVAPAQALRHELADRTTALKSSRLLTLQTARRIAQNEVVPGETSMVKVHVTEACLDIVEACLRLQGMAGFSGSREIERYVRDARLLLIAGGPNDNHRNTVADSILESTSS